jgi:hypothetical protein
LPLNYSHESRPRGAAGKSERLEEILVSFTTGLATLFRRDLSKLIRQIESFPNDEMLWKTLPGITNSAGNLALHLEGNLREFVGRQLGNLPYHRERPLEFGRKGISREEIVTSLTALQLSIPSVIEKLSSEQIAQQYPQVVLDTAMSSQDFLLHLYGHLNWHLGQIDYLRRILAGEGEEPLVRR